MEVVMFSVLQEEVGSFAFQLGCDQKQFTNEIPAFFGFFFFIGTQLHSNAVWYFSVWGAVSKAAVLQ